MAKFYTSQNKGIIAVISEAHAKLYGVVQKAGGDPTAAGCRVFTFTDKSRFERDISEKMTFTGTIGDLEYLIKAGSHSLERGYTDVQGWDGYVPFSNGKQYGYRLGDEVDGYETDLRFVTTLRDIIEAFGHPFS